jgi:hypothetical protein
MVAHIQGVRFIDIFESLLDISMHLFFKVKEAQGMFQNILLAEYHETFCDILLLANLQNKFE